MVSDEVVEVEAFCRRIRPRLVGAIGFHVADHAVAEELAQEAFVRTWQRWPRVRTLDNPEAWTFRVGINLATSALRRRGAERRARSRMGHVPIIEPDPPTAEALAIRAAVRALPARRRTAVVCRYFLDLSVAQTAEVMGCAPGTVTAMCSAAITQLRAAGLRLDDEHPEEVRRG